MTEHTPGPWYFSGNEEHFPGQFNIRSNHHPDGEGALLFETGSMFHEYSRNASEMKANARLIAMAPELLVALEGIAGFKDQTLLGGRYEELLEAAPVRARNTPYELSHEIGAHKAFNQCASIARAAIAKATQQED